MTVSGAIDAAFNGVYEASDLTVGWAAYEEVYQRGDKFIFRLDSPREEEWGIGSIASLTSGDVDYRGSYLIRI